MPQYRVEFTLAALLHIENIADYHLRMAGANSAEKITDKLLNSFAVLADHPLAGAKHPDPVLERYGYRKLVCGEYVGVYRLADKTIFVYGVFHGAVNYPELFK